MPTPSTIVWADLSQKGVQKPHFLCHQKWHFFLSLLFHAKEKESVAQAAVSLHSLARLCHELTTLCTLRKMTVEEWEKKFEMKVGEVTGKCWVTGRGVVGLFGSSHATSDGTWSGVDRQGWTHENDGIAALRCSWKSGLSGGRKWTFASESGSSRKSMTSRHWKWMTWMSISATWLSNCHPWLAGKSLFCRLTMRRMRNWWECCLAVVISQRYLMTMKNVVSLESEIGVYIL